MNETQQRGDHRGGKCRGRDDRRNQASREEKNQYPERVVAINHVAKVVQGGCRLSFIALVVVGDDEGTVGVGYGKTKEVLATVVKGVEEAKKHFSRVPLIQRTIPHLMQGEETVGVVLLRPASPGTGVVAGGSTRAVLEYAGVHDALVKSLGSANTTNVIHVTVDVLQQLKEPKVVVRHRSLPVENVVPAALLRVRKEEVAG